MENIKNVKKKKKEEEGWCWHLRLVRTQEASNDGREQTCHI